MAIHHTARDLARDKITADILDEARRQLADRGAAGLSIRSVAREVGMVPSALYRYVASRDDLLTRLIVDAYNSLGDHVETAIKRSSADAPDGPGAEQWVAAAHAVRDWALEHRHEYTLVYGSPVPGYEAPATTSDPGTRASRALVRLVAEAAGAGRLGPGNRQAQPLLGADLTSDFDVLRGELGADLDDRVMLDLLIGWTQLFGLVSFEVFGQTRGLVSHHRDFFEACARRTAADLGLR